jgi:peptidoglycan hydrolase CwlO-like protein
MPNNGVNNASTKSDQRKIKQLETRINILNNKLDVYKQRIVDQEARIMSLENTLKMLGMN